MLYVSVKEKLWNVEDRILDLEYIFYEGNLIFTITAL